MRCKTIYPAQLRVLGPTTIFFIGSRNQIIAHKDMTYLRDLRSICKTKHLIGGETTNKKAEFPSHRRAAKTRGWYTI